MQITNFILQNGGLGRSYSLRKIDEVNQQESPPYPGVIIEEMLDSASTHNENFPIVMHNGEATKQEPDVSINSRM